MNMFLLITIIILILIIVFRFDRNIFDPPNKGTIGESRVANRLNRIQGEEYRTINDVLITIDGKSSQIDHIVVSTYGIFVIETKNYSGWIHGNENSQYWLQTIYRKKIRFYNPIKQNYGHINALKKVLSSCQYVIPYYSIIVFTGSAELKNIHTTTPVIYGGELVDTILNQSKTCYLSIEQVKDITDRLNEINIHDKDAKSDHISQTISLIYEQKRKDELLICPKCGSSLIVRNGQYNEFYGCQNYPKCRYTLHC